MSLFGDIMNIQINNDSKSIAREALTDSGGVHIAYKIGHRDARHDAAELAMTYDNLVDVLERNLEDTLSCVDSLSIRMDLEQMLEVIQKVKSGEYK